MNKIAPIIENNIKERYVCDIRGFGEIYEMMSVRKLQIRLIRRFKDGCLFLSPNKDHSGFGYTCQELVQFVKNRNLAILDYGYTDSFIFKSKVKYKEKPNPLVNSKVLVLLSKFIFYFLLQLEPLVKNKNRSHKVYVLAPY